MRTRRWWRTAAMATVGIAALGLTACGDDGNGGSAGDDRGEDGGSTSAAGEVTVVEFSFEPESVEVTAGDDVTWTNEDDFDHQITVRDGGFESDPFGGGESVSTSFTDPGSYEYFCGIHNSMTGTITVT